MSIYLGSIIVLQSSVSASVDSSSTLGSYILRMDMLNDSHKTSRTVEGTLKHISFFFFKRFFSPHSPTPGRKWIILNGAMGAKIFSFFPVMEV